jgi:hypothetical protein
MLTYWSVGVQRLVIEAENRCQVVEIGVLRNEIPLGVVHSVVEVCHRDLDPPVLLVVNLDVPVDSYWAHVRSALDQRCQAVLEGIIHNRSQIRRVASVRRTTQAVRQPSK